MVYGKLQIWCQQAAYTLQFFITVFKVLLHEGKLVGSQNKGITKIDLQSLKCSHCYEYTMRQLFHSRFPEKSIQLFIKYEIYWQHWMYSVKSV